MEWQEEREERERRHGVRRNTGSIRKCLSEATAPTKIARKEWCT